MLIGRVKVWKQIEGWGFIEDDDGEDYFFNISNVRMGQRIRLGSNVKFDTQQTQRGIEAINVSLT